MGECIPEKLPNRQCDTDGCNGSVTVGAMCDRCIVSKELPLTREKIHNLLVSNIKAKLSCRGLVKELTGPERTIDEINAFLDAMKWEKLFAAIPVDLLTLAGERMHQNLLTGAEQRGTACFELAFELAVSDR